MTGAALLGELPALPLHTAGRYVAGAYVVLFALVLVYVAIMAIRLGRIERDLGELLSISASSPHRPGTGEGERPGEPAAQASAGASAGAVEQTSAGGLEQSAYPKGHT